MFDIDNIHHSIFELADFVEYNALSDSEGSQSIEALRSRLSAPEDELVISGTEEGDDKVLTKLKEALTYCSSRSNSFTIYPFDVNVNSLNAKNTEGLKSYCYLFLLLANRLDMRKENVQGGKDATELFERLCGCVASEYFGSHSKCEVFGTSVEGPFKDKVNDILKKMHISGEYKEPFGGTGHHRDGGVDLVAWIPFSDNKDSCLIAIGQCKTGDTWEGYLKKVDFFLNYSTAIPLVDPLYMFFVTEDFGSYKWEERSRNAGLLFDRKRILEYLPAEIGKYDNNLEADIIAWVTAAKEYIQKI